MPTQEKAEAIAALHERVKRASALYFLDFTGLGANEFNQLRRQLQASGASVRVVKNRLMLRALRERGVSEDVAALLRQPTSLVFANEDPVAPARTIRDLARQFEALVVKGAYVDNRIYGAEQFAMLASLPTKGDLRAQLVGVLASPITGLALSLDGLLSGLVYVLDRIGERKGQVAAA